MASVLTNNNIPGSVVAPLTLTTVAASPQFNAPSLTAKSIGQVGNAVVTLPSPSLSPAGSRRYRVVTSGIIAIGATATVVNLSPTITDTAGTATSTGTVATASLQNTTVAFSVSFDFVLDPASSNPLTGVRYGFAGATAYTPTTLTGGNLVVLTGTGNITFGLLAAVATAGTNNVLTVREIALELL